MEIIDPTDEFSPLEGDRLDFLLTICGQLEAIAENDWISTDEQECLKLARHHIMILIAQGMAGYELYRQTNDMLRNMYDDLLTLCDEYQIYEMPTSRLRYEKYLSEGPNLDATDA